MANIIQKLKNERLALGLKLTDVSERMGFKNYQTLRSIEESARELKASELVKLAQIYGRPIDYFLKPSKPQESQPKVLWRNMTKEAERPVSERTFVSFCNNYQKLFELTEETIPSVLSLESIRADKAELVRRSYSYIEELARELSRLLQLGSRPACSLPIVLEEALGVKIIYLDFSEVGSAAASKDEYFGEAILINANDAPWRRNFDMAHELFHLITWDIFTDEEIFKDDDKSQVEKWADSFASAILLPADEVKREFSRRTHDNSIDMLSLVEIAREFRVSIEALLWRLVNLNMLAKSQVVQALESGDIKDIDKKLRGFSWQDEKPALSRRYVGLAIRALQDGKISKMKLAEYVSQSFSDLPAFLRRYGYDENEDYSREFDTVGR